MSARYIVIPGWERFQHYKDRTPLWIKNYTELLADEAYLRLSGHQRGVLHGLWMEYASARRQIPDSTLSVSRRLGLKVSRATLDALNHAGYIAYSASRPLAEPYQPASPEVELPVEVQKDLKPPDQKPLLTTPPTGLENESPQETLEQLAARLAAQAAPLGSEGRLLEVLTDMDANSPAVIHALLETLPAHTIEEVRQEVLDKQPRSPVKYAVGMLQKRAAKRTNGAVTAAQPTPP